MLKSTRLFSQALAFLSIATIGIACKDDDIAAEEVLPSQNAQVNDWIYKNMQTYYLWTDQLPATTNKEEDPTDYFKGLLSNEDRFSFITPDYDALIKSLEGVTLEAGYEFSLTRVSEGSNDVWAFVSYVKPNSPAKQAGLKRGDVITHINNQQITVSNYKELLGQISDSHSIGYQRYNATTQELEPQPTLSLNTLELAENPHFMDTVYTMASGKKVGYYVYTFFSPGTNANEYDQQMDNIIADFKSQGVNELVLDLRYNSGGAVSSATNLASLIGRNVSSTQIFYENRWNSQLQEYIESRSDADEILRGKFRQKGTTIGNDLASGTLYVLTDFRTASASELIINGLKPYMNVVLVGGKTYGKNVGSIPIEDEENEENTYGMLPIVFAISNSQGFHDYGDGFVPNIEVSDLAIPMKELGDVEEPLLATALAIIEGDSGAKIAGDKPLRAKRFRPIGSSLERKAWTNRTILDKVPVNDLRPF
jgi:carboxyl-terminal processing protease